MDTETLERDDLGLWLALGRLIADYWADVDENSGATAHRFYLPDGLFAVGNNRFQGQEKIRAFYERRRKQGSATTRHLLSNLRVFAGEEWRARMVGVMSLYRADGKLPIIGAKPPAMIADFEARCVLAEDGSWRFQSHILRPVFVGSDLPASITIDPQRL
jgi:hypothetical protein